MKYSVIHYPAKVSSRESSGGTPFTLEITKEKVKLKNCSQSLSFYKEWAEYQIKNKHKHNHKTLLTNLYYLQSVRKYGYRKLNLLRLMKKS